MNLRIRRGWTGAPCFLVAFALLGGAIAASAENVAVVPVPKEDADWLKRNQSMQEQLTSAGPAVLWIGDSIVERFEKGGKPVWDQYYAHRKAVNLGISGDRTEHVLWRLDHYDFGALQPKLAIVMIGQNNGGDNTAEEIAEGVQAVITRLQAKLPTTKILVLGIFFRGEKPNDEQLKLAKTNERLAGMADGKQVFYQNVNAIFLAPDGTIRKDLMPDFEHPNEAGCRVWAEAIEPTVARLFGDTPVTP